MLRDRLREVLERDRALLDATRSFTHGFTEEESGTRMRLPRAKPRALDPDEIASIDALLSGDFAPTTAVADRSPAAEPYTPNAAPDVLADEPDTSPSSRGARADEPRSASASSAPQPSAAWQAARSWRGTRQRHQLPDSAPEAAVTQAPASSLTSETPALPALTAATGVEPPQTAAPTRTPATLTGPLPAFDLTPAFDLWQDTQLPAAVDFAGSRGLEPRAATEPPHALSLFADWIAEEVGELSGLSPAPIVLTPELAPTLHTATLAPGAPEEGEEPRSGQEPIRTRTMARLLAGHGYKARALSIYDELLARRPDDADLRAEAEALRRAAK